MFVSEGLGFPNAITLMMVACIAIDSGSDRLITNGMVRCRWQRLGSVTRDQLQAIADRTLAKVH